MVLNMFFHVRSVSCYLQRIRSFANSEDVNCSMHLEKLKNTLILTLHFQYILQKRVPIFKLSVCCAGNLFNIPTTISYTLHAILDHLR